MAKSQQPKSLTDSYPSTVGAVHHFTVPDGYHLFEVSYKHFLAHATGLPRGLYVLLAIISFYIF